jgi:hypothetical protein
MKFKFSWELAILSIIIVFLLVEFIKYIYDSNTKKNKLFTLSEKEHQSMNRFDVENFDSIANNSIKNNNNQITSQEKPIDDSDVPDAKFPFKNIRDENGKKMNIILISAPFRSEEDEETYENMKQKGLNFCGISSYLDFPDHIVNPFEDRFHEKRNHDYINMVSSWLYCFRELPPILAESSLPMMLMAEADLKDTEGYYKPDPNIKKEYDFMYVCLDDDESPDSKCVPGWQWYNRNWDLAKLCLETMCRDYQLKGIIVGRTNCEFTQYCSGIVKVVPFMSFHEFQTEMKKCKFLFVPNISDASPRVMTEAMCYNIPVLTNYNIIGGWHNVIPGVTGEFFTDEKNVKTGLDAITKNYDTYRAREWYCANRGRNNSGKQLADFLKEHYPNLNNPNIKTADI